MKQKRKKKIAFDFNLMEASSSTECTGITPRPPLNENELESYKEVFDFGPPIAKKEKK